MPKTLFPEFVSDVMEVAGEKEDNYSRKELYESKAGGMQYGCTRKEQGQKRLPHILGIWIPQQSSITPQSGKN